MNNFLDANADGLALALIFGVLGLALLLIAALVQFLNRTPKRHDDWDRVADRRRRIDRRGLHVRSGFNDFTHRRQP